MSVGLVAFRYPAPEYVEELIASCHQVIEAGCKQPGIRGL